MFDKKHLNEPKNGLSVRSHVLDGGLAPDIKVGNDILKLLVNLLCAIFHADKLAASVTLVDLTGTDDLVLGVLSELVPVGKPSRESRKSEHDGEHLGGDAESLVDDTRVEVNVGVELPLDEVLVGESDALKLHGDVDHRLAADNSENVVGKLADESGTRVKVLVHAVTEAHEDLLAVLHILHELRDVLDITNLVEHAEDSLVSTTVTGSVKGGDSTSERRVDIRLG